ncbi:hypothetical protein C2E31_28130, partial [Rhodopirellula baltica]
PECSAWQGGSLGTSALLSAERKATMVWLWLGRREPVVQRMTRREPCYECATFGGAKGDNG